MFFQGDWLMFRDMLMLHNLPDLFLLPLLSQDDISSKNGERMECQSNTPAEEWPVEPQHMGRRQQVECEQKNVDAYIDTRMGVKVAKLLNASLSPLVTLIRIHFNAFL